MERFYFHLFNDVDAHDEEGVELADLDAAREHAKADARFTAGEVLKEDGRLNLDHRIEITDAAGTMMDTVYFRDVLNVEG